MTTIATFQASLNARYSSPTYTRYYSNADLLTTFDQNNEFNRIMNKIQNINVFFIKLLKDPTQTYLIQNYQTHIQSVINLYNKQLQDLINEQYDQRRHIEYTAFINLKNAKIFIFQVEIAYLTLFINIVGDANKTNINNYIIDWILDRYNFIKASTYSYIFFKEFSYNEILDFII